MNKQKVKEIVKFSIRQNIQNKWFVIFNVFLFIFAIIMTNAGNIRQFLENNNINLFNDEVVIEYIDNENLMGNKLQKQFEQEEKITITKIKENNYTKENIEDNLLVVEVNLDEDNIIVATLTSKEGMDSFICDEVLEVLEDVRLEVLAEKINAKESDLENLNKDVVVERVMLGVNTENSDTKQFILQISTMLVYMVSIFIFSKIANEISQEKVSKSIEYVLTSVTAKEYLLAKIISITSVVLIQGVYILTYYFIGNLINTIINLSTGVSFESLTTEVFASLDKDIVQYIVIVFVYSVLTIILLSIIQAALSSKTTSMSEAGNTMTFLMVITISVYILTFALINPYTNMTVGMYILSCIPLVSNYFIPAIIIIGQATTMQIVISLLLLVISIPIAFNICAKIFKNGVLDYKTNKKQKKIKKELSLKEEQEKRISTNELKRIAFVIGISIILLIVMQLIIQILMELLVVPFLNEILNESQINLIVSALISIISMLCPALFVLMYAKKTTKFSKETSADITIYIFLVTILQLLLILIQQVLGIENKSTQVLIVDGLDNVVTAILFFINIAIIPAIFEELYFRKALISLTRKFGNKFAIFISAVAFGLIHMNMVQGIFAFFMGLILGNLYVKTNSMKLNVLIHGLNNGYTAICAILIANNLELPIYILDAIVIAIAIFGAIKLFVKIIKKMKQKEKIIDFKEKLFPENFKYIFSDFTFVLAIIFAICTFIVTESFLKML